MMSRIGTRLSSNGRFWGGDGAGGLAEFAGIFALAIDAESVGRGWSGGELG